jgi:hypothetical protein
MNDIILDPFGSYDSPCDVRALARRVDWRSRLVAIDHFPGLPVRLAAVANALSLIGVQAGNPQTLRIFDDLLGPPYKWPLHKPYGQGGISTCSMVALGVLRRMGIASDGVMNRYTIGTGMRVAHNFAKTSGAFVVSGRPRPGDMIDLCPYERSKDRSNHTEIVIGWAENGRTLVCVSGGQVGLGGLQSISITRRPWIEAEVPRAGTRQVYGWIDVERLSYLGVCFMPEGVLNV